MGDVGVSPLVMPTLLKTFALRGLMPIQIITGSVPPVIAKIGQTRTYQGETYMTTSSLAHAIDYTFKMLSLKNQTKQNISAPNAVLQKQVKRFHHSLASIDTKLEKALRKLMPTASINFDDQYDDLLFVVASGETFSISVDINENATTAEEFVVFTVSNTEGSLKCHTALEIRAAIKTLYSKVLKKYPPKN